MDLQDDNGRDKEKPCWLGTECQLARDQQTGNDLLRDILRELRHVNKSLIGPATGANRVPVRVLLWVIVVFTALLVLERLTKSGYELDASANHLAVTQAEKKTE
jgi:hypothetical protein